MTRRNKERVLMLLDAVIVIGIIGAVVLALILLNRLNAQAKNTHEDSLQSTAIIEGDLRCLGTFFSLPDRSNLRITDLHKCTIENTKTHKHKSLNAAALGSGIASFNSTSLGATTSPTVSTPKSTASKKASTPGNSGNTPAPQPNPGIVQRIISAVPNAIHKVL